MDSLDPHWKSTAMFKVAVEKNLQDKNSNIIDKKD